MAVIEWLQNVFEGQKKLSEERRFFRTLKLSLRTYGANGSP